MKPFTILILATGCCLVTTLVTFRMTADHQSCAGCRSVRVSNGKSMFGIPFDTSERLSLSSDEAAHHAHKWWTYSLHTSSVLGKTFACKRHLYEDGTDYGVANEPNENAAVGLRGAEEVARNGSH